jgi:FkbM family methyltransferase
MDATTAVDVFRVPRRHHAENLFHSQSLRLQERPATKPLAMVLKAAWLALHMSQNAALGRRLPAALVRQAHWQARRRFSGKPITVQMDGGYALVLPAHSHMAGTTYATGLHEPREQLFALAYLRPGDVTVDVGANIGIFTAMLASTGAEVRAFEPGTQSREDLRRTLAVNPDAVVTVVPAALSDKPGTFALTLDLESSNHLIEGDPHGITESVEDVDVIRLDDYLQEQPVGRLDFIKIDAEGFDLNVLRGGQCTLQKYKPALMVETWGSSGVRNWLESNGYRMYRYAFEVRQLVEYPKPFTRPANIIAVHDERFAETRERLKSSSAPPLGLPRPLRRA